MICGPAVHAGRHWVLSNAVPQLFDSYRKAWEEHVSRAFRCSVRARIQCANKPLPSERLASRLARRCRVLCPSARGEAAKNRLPAVDTCATSNFRADCYLPLRVYGRVEPVVKALERKRKFGEREAPSST